MGDRVLVTFTDGEDFSPFVYMHWHGEEAADMIRKAQKHMRIGDYSYAAARFCGFCHVQLKSATRGRVAVLGLGLLNGPQSTPTAEEWAELSHGDAGIYVVNVSTGEVGAYGGYGKPFQLDREGFADE